MNPLQASFDRMVTYIENLADRFDALAAVDTHVTLHELRGLLRAYASEAHSLISDVRREVASREGQPVSQHTPCTCYVERDVPIHQSISGPRIIFCPIHAAAPRMLALIGAWMDKGLLTDMAADDARAVLKEIDE